MLGLPTAAPVMASFLGTMVDSCLSPCCLWCTLSLACHSFASVFTDLGYMFFFFFSDFLFRLHHPPWRWDCITWQHLVVLLYEKIYFNIQSANYFPKKDRGFSLPGSLAEEKTGCLKESREFRILSGLTLFLVCTLSCNRALITVNTCWPHTNFWAEPPGLLLFPDKSGRFSIATATG